MKHSDPNIMRRAFTLVELLMVVAIIGVLAALVLSGTRYASKVTKLNRIRTELRELETAIENYKSKLGFYPPDSANPAMPPLYYELLGVYGPSGGPYTSKDGQNVIVGADINAAFGFLSFANTAPTVAEAQSFLPELNTKKFTRTNNVEVLRPTVVSAENWRYVSRNAKHNPKTYDLWTEIVIAGDTYRVGNWKTGR